MNKLAGDFNPWGGIPLPPPLEGFNTVQEGGIGQLINLFLNILIVGAGLYALINFILAGYGFLSAGGDSKKVADASAKIYMSVIGLVVAAGALVLGAIFGRLIFGEWDALIAPAIPIPIS